MGCHNISGHFHLLFHCPNNKTNITFIYQSAIIWLCYVMLNTQLFLKPQHIHYRAHTLSQLQKPFFSFNVYLTAKSLFHSRTHGNPSLTSLVIMVTHV